MTNGTSNEQFVSLCCKPDERVPEDSFCYRNGTFPVWQIFTTILSNFSIALVSRELTCNGTFFDLEYYPPNNDVFYLREDGAIHVVKSIYSGWTDHVINASRYCVTSHLTEDGRKVAISVCDPSPNIEGSAILFAEGPLVPRIAVGLSLPFLAATFLVYTILPELNNVPGFALRAYVTSLFVVLTLDFIVTGNHELACDYFIVLAMYFSVMAYFIWVTVMCFDIWWTFRQVRSVQSQSKRGHRKKCLMYSISAWGSAALITGVGVIIDSVPTVPKGIIRPGLRDVCGFYDPVAFNIYWIGPIGLTVICNICFFVLTAITLIRHEKSTAHRLHGNDEQWYKNEKNRFFLYLKLFIVMGVICMADVINGLWQEDIPEYIGILLDLPSSLQGVNIFVIFVCKKKIKNLLLERFGRRDNTLPQNVELRPRN